MTDNHKDTKQTSDILLKFNILYVKNKIQNSFSKSVIIYFLQFEKSGICIAGMEKGAFTFNLVVVTAPLTGRNDAIKNERTKN